jgi:hypothetical protein
LLANSTGLGFVVGGRLSDAINEITTLRKRLGIPT